MTAWPVFKDIKNTLLHWAPQLGREFNKVGGFNDSIDNNTGQIAINKSNIAINAGNISTNTTNIGINTTNIATNTADIAIALNTYPQTLDTLSTEVTLSNTFTETSMYSYAIPGAQFTTRGGLRARSIYYLTYNNDASDNLRFKIELGGTLIIDTNAFPLKNGLSSSPAIVISETSLFQRGSSSSHVTESRIRIHDQGDGAVGGNPTNFTEFFYHKAFTLASGGGLLLDFRAAIGGLSPNLSILSLGGWVERVQ